MDEHSNPIRHSFYSLYAKEHIKRVKKCEVMSTVKILQKTKLHTAITYLCWKQITPQTARAEMKHAVRDFALDYSVVAKWCFKCKDGSASCDNAN
jgi:hypothetical protein